MGNLKLINIIFLLNATFNYKLIRIERSNIKDQIPTDELITEIWKYLLIKIYHYEKLYLIVLHKLLGKLFNVRQKCGLTNKIYKLNKYNYWQL